MKSRMIMEFKTCGTEVAPSSGDRKNEEREMEQLGQVSLLQDLYSDKIASSGDTPVETGNQLFRSLLAKSANSEKARSAVTQEQGGSLQAAAETGVASLEAKLRRLGLPMDQLRLPGSALPQLFNLLERQGFQREEIQSLIDSLKEKDGSIRMDRLLARLGKSRSAAAENDLLIKAKDIPLISEALLAMGLGAGKIKEAIESSTNRKGELSLEKLSGSLERSFPALDAKSLLSSVLERCGIQARGRLDQAGATDPDLKKLMREFSEAQGEDMQKKIKEEIARLMREKGVPPQEVKSFLESLTAGRAGSLAKNVIWDQDGGKKADADAKGLMDKLVLGTERKQPDGEWQGKIVEALQKEKGSGKETMLEKGLLQEEAFLKASAGDQVKAGEQKAKAMPMESVRAAEAGQKHGTETLESAATRKGNQVEQKPATAREAIPSDLSAVRIQKDNLEAVAGTRAKETAALPEPLPKIVDKMLWMIQGGEQKGRIQISPPELGRLDLDLAIKNGHLQAQLSAESPQVKDLLEANLSQLKQQLADMGLVVDRFNVSVGLEQNPFARQEMWNSGQRRSRSSDRDAEERIASKPETMTLHRAGNSLSQVDMMV